MKKSLIAIQMLRCNIYFGYILVSCCQKVGVDLDSVILMHKITLVVLTFLPYHSYTWNVLYFTCTKIKALWLFHVHIKHSGSHWRNLRLNLGGRWLIFHLRLKTTFYQHLVIICFTHYICPWSQELKPHINGVSGKHVSYLITEIAFHSCRM